MNRWLVLFMLIRAAIRAAMTAGFVTVVLWLTLGAKDLGAAATTFFAMVTVGWLLFVPLAMGVAVIFVSLPALMFGCSLILASRKVALARHPLLWALTGASFGALVSWGLGIPQEMFHDPKLFWPGFSAATVAGALAALVFRRTIRRLLPAHGTTSGLTRSLAPFSPNRP